jgi:hypothetical protein
VDLSAASLLPQCQDVEASMQVVPLPAPACAPGAHQ